MIKSLLSEANVLWKELYESLLHPPLTPFTLQNSLPCLNSYSTHPGCNVPTCTQEHCKTPSKLKLNGPSALPHPQSDYFITEDNEMRQTQLRVSKSILSVPSHIPAHVSHRKGVPKGPEP